LTPVSSIQHRITALEMALRPIILFSNKPISIKQSLINLQALPFNCQVVSLEQLSANKILLRIENIFEQKDNQNSGKVDLLQLMPKVKISKVEETFLAANILKKKSQTRLIPLTKASKTIIYPMMIRTFIITTA
jgi:hypothetical protein